MPLSPVSLSVQLKIRIRKATTLNRITLLFSASKFILWSTAPSLQLKELDVQEWEQMTRHRNLQTGFPTKETQQVPTPHIHLRALKALPKPELLSLSLHHSHMAVNIN